MKGMNDGEEEERNKELGRKRRRRRRRRKEEKYMAGGSAEMLKNVIAEMNNRWQTSGIVRNTRRRRDRDKESN